MVNEMAGINTYILVIFVVIFLVIGTGAQSNCEKCGYSGRCCKYDEVCEENVAGGTCYKRTDKVSCNSFYYCYSPTTCCGFGSCCPENSKCCGLNTCCPEGSTCCSTECCGSGYKCNGAYCEAKSYSSNYTFSWYYILFIILPLIAVCGALGRRMRHRSAMTQAQTGRVILRNDYSVPTNTTAPDTNMTNMFAPPPCYDEIVANPGAPNSYNDEAAKAKIPEPPPYSEVMSQPTVYSDPNAPPVESSESDTNAAASGVLNEGFQTEPNGNRA